MPRTRRSASARPTISSARGAPPCAAARPRQLRRRCAAQRPGPHGAGHLVTRRRGCRCRSPPSSCWRSGYFLLFGWGSSVETYAAQLAPITSSVSSIPPEASSSPRRHAARADVAGRRRAGRSRSPRRRPMEQLTAARRPPVRIIARACRSYPLSMARRSRCRCTCSTHRFDRSADAAHDHDVTRLGEHAIVWTEHERTYAVVAEPRLPDLQRVAIYVRRSIE